MGITPSLVQGWRIKINPERASSVWRDYSITRFGPYGIVEVRDRGGAVIWQRMRCRSRSRWRW